MIEYWLGLSPWKKIKLVFMLIVGILVMVFAVINWQIVEVDFIFFRIKLSITLLIITCLGIGYGLSTVFEYRTFKKKDEEIKLLKSKLEPKENSSLEK
jgi:uncharacterized integral membrane protein